MRQLLITIAAVVLVGCGPDISIHEASRTGNIEAVKQHLAAGVDVNAKDEFGQTPLHLADSRGKEIAELLIAEGADVNAKDEFGQTPLHLAAFSGHKEIAELLLAEGADVDAKNEDGWAPLALAFDALPAPREGLIKLLIANGADVNAKVDGYTQLDYFLLGKYHEAYDLLRKHGGKTSEELKAEGK